MNEKIKTIIEIQKFIKDFDTLLKNRSRSLFQCENKEFKTNYSELYNRLKRFYKFIFDVNMSENCSQAFLERYFEIKEINLKQLINMANIEHKLKKNSRVYNIEGKFYSWKSQHLTNEICEKIYKFDPSAFEYYDKDWRAKKIIEEKQVVDAMANLEVASFFDAKHNPQPDMVKEVIPEPEVAAESEPAPRTKAKEKERNKNKTESKPKPKPFFTKKS